MQETACLTTIGDWLRWSVSRFREAGLYYGHGTDNAWDEALTLIMHSLYLPIDVNPVVLDAKITEDERKNLLKILNRRIKDRIPTPYLTNHAIFAGLDFYVDERVLIPRSSLAELIENKFEPWITKPPESILDLCTGSACIALACRNEFPNTKIIASDISKEALEVAKINLERFEQSSQVTLYESDLFNQIPKQQFDIIISNPPYVDTTDMRTLPAEYTHEPELGLKAGTTGLDVVIRILQHAHEYLSPDGILIVEVGNSEAALIEKLPEAPFTWLQFTSGDTGVFLLTAKQLSCLKFNT